MLDFFKSKKETAPELKQQGNILLSQGQFSAAEQLYRRAIKLDSDFMPAHYNLGNALRAQGRAEEALAAFEAACRLAPDDYEIFMNIGATLIDLGRPADALQAFIRANQIVPAAAEPLVNIGLAYEHLADISHRNIQTDINLDKAIEHYRQAIFIRPDFAEAYNNLGNALLARGQLDEAIESLRWAISLKEDFAEAHNNLGNALHSQGQLHEAVESFQRAITLKADFADAHYNMGKTFSDLMQYDQAEASYARVLAINPNHIKALGSYGGLLLKFGQQKRAMVCFQQVMALDPGNVSAAHMIASISGIDTPSAPGPYVEDLFDSCAHQFEARLVDQLKYDVPKNLVALIMETAKPETAMWDVLDLGCGTGLVGQEISPYARHLVGVDLSAGMLAKAKEKNLYQRLEKGEMLTMMTGEPSSSYDLIISADVFIYVGRLDEIMEEAQRLLRPGGFLAFSIEAMEMPASNEITEEDAKDYRLQSSGRYAHALSYINKLVQSGGFSKHNLQPVNVRLENGTPIPGWLVLLENKGH